MGEAEKKLRDSKAIVDWLGQAVQDIPSDQGPMGPSAANDIKLHKTQAEGGSMKSYADEEKDLISSGLKPGSTELRAEMTKRGH